jgi:GTP-dependent phosphoenolpyruvate carboxykinase
VVEVMKMAAEGTEMVVVVAESTPSTYTLVSIVKWKTKRKKTHSQSTCLCHSNARFTVTIDQSNAILTVSYSEPLALLL